jgi:hypothetical protein
MRKIILFLLGLSVLTSFYFIQKSKDYFEGRVEYEVSYQPFDTRFNEEDLLENDGSKIILTFKEGNYKREYYGKTGKLIKKVTYNQKENVLYIVANDTIYYYSPVGTYMQLNKLIQGKDEKVLNQVCKSYYVELFDPLAPAPIQTTKYQYFVDPQLSVNPDWYRQFTEGSWDKIMASLNSITLKHTMEQEWYKQTVTATRVDRRKIELAEFKIPDHLPRKELKL